MGTPSICDQLASSLDTKQIQFCKKHPGFMTSVQTGATRAIDECKFQFRTRRWNCSTLDDDDVRRPTIVSLPSSISSSSAAATGAMLKRANKKRKMKEKNSRKSSSFQSKCFIHLPPGGGRGGAGEGPLRLLIYTCK